MNKGTLAQRYLDRSVIKHIKTNNKQTIAKSAIGNDFANIDGIISTCGFSDNLYLAWTKALNNFACSGGICLGVHLNLYLPTDVKESNIKSIMEEFNLLANRDKIQILGGHTEVSPIFSTFAYNVNVIGKSANFLPDRKKIKPGFDIIMTKGTAIYGSDYLLNTKREELENRFASSYLDGANNGVALYSVVNDSKVCLDNNLDNIFYMHDVSYGGIFGALWQLAKWINKGVEINLNDVIIKQETIEMCEYFNLNPYMLDGTGALLLVANNGLDVVEKLNSNGILASVIGKVLDNNEKVVITRGGDRRNLEPFDDDEINKI